MLKTALFDFAINEECCSVDGGRGICPLFSSPPRGIWQLKSPHPRKFAIHSKKKMLMPGGQPLGRGLGAAGIDWCINFTRFLHILFMRFKTKGYDVIDLNLFHFKLMRFHFKNPDKSVPSPLLTEFEFEVANLDWKKILTDFYALCTFCK